MEKAILGCKGSFILIFFGEFDLLISSHSIQCRKYRCFPRRSVTFVLAWYQVRILDLHFVQLELADAKAESSVLREKKIIGEGHFV